MNQAQLWSLRLGFSIKQAAEIEKKGLKKFLENSFQERSSFAPPKYLKGTPKTIEVVRKLRRKIKKNNEAKLRRQFIQLVINHKSESIERCYNADYPLTEKMMLFWQNHFVSTYKKVKVPYWMYEYEQAIRQHSFGNYKDLVKAVVYTNAMLAYLDNNQNHKDNLNENLGRELLELFTLGEGNYSESDIKNTAKSLAGLTAGNGKGQYRALLKDNSNKTVFGKTGNFTIDEVIDIIFEQENTPYFITEKLLRWFIYDTPPADLVQQYGRRLKALNFEIAPFLTEVFLSEYEKNNAGAKIKNPLEFTLQLHHELSIEPNFKILAFYLQSQGMDMYDQPNVKGWQGGRNWITTQTYTGRQELIDLLLVDDKRVLKKIAKNLKSKEFDLGELNFSATVAFEKGQSAKEIKQNLANRLLYEVNESVIDDMDEVMRYDFDSTAENANETVKRLFQHITHLPKFQLI